MSANILHNKARVEEKVNPYFVFGGNLNDFLVFQDLLGSFIKIKYSGDVLVIIVVLRGFMIEVRMSKGEVVLILCCKIFFRTK